MIFRNCCADPIPKKFHINQTEYDNLLILFDVYFTENRTKTIVSHH